MTDAGNVIDDVTDVGKFADDFVQSSTTYSYKGINLQTDLQGNVKLYRAMSEIEYNSIKSNEIFSAGQGSMETKWMATSQADAQRWANIMDFGSNPKIVEITLPKYTLDNFYYPGSNLDNIGPAFSSEINYLKQVLKSVK